MFNYLQTYGKNNSSVSFWRKIRKRIRKSVLKYTIYDFKLAVLAVLNKPETDVSKGRNKLQKSVDHKSVISAVITSKFIKQL